MPTSDRLPVYHEPGDNPRGKPGDGHRGEPGDGSRDALLCRVMAAALTSYCGLAVDIARGKVDAAYESWLDFDDVEAFSVSEICASNVGASGMTAEQIGLLVVWYDATPICSVDGLADAKELITEASGCLVELIADDIAGPYWWVERIDGPAGPVTEPPFVDLPRRRRVPG